MINKDPIKDVKQRVALVSKWESRLAKLANRVDNPMNATVFCLKYGLNRHWLCRVKKMKPLPLWRKINQVENALKSEGV